MNNVEMAFENVAQTSGRVRATDRMHEILRDAIIHGRLAPRSLLAEGALANSLKVSRTPVREALRQLQSEGLVERSISGRLYVTNISAKEASDVFAVRIALEDLVLVELPNPLNPLVLAKLEACVARMEALLRTPQGDVGDEGTRFHAVLYQASGNRTNQDVLHRLQHKIDRYRFLSTAALGRQEQAVKEHREICAALQAHDTERARATLRRHLEQARRVVLERLETSLDIGTEDVTYNMAASTGPS